MRLLATNVCESVQVVVVLGFSEAVRVESVQVVNVVVLGFSAAVSRRGMREYCVVAAVRRHRASRHADTT